MSRETSSWGENANAKTRTYIFGERTRWLYFWREKQMMWFTLHAFVQRIIPHDLLPLPRKCFLQNNILPFIHNQHLLYPTSFKTEFQNRASRPNFKIELQHRPCSTSSLFNIELQHRACSTSNILKTWLTFRCVNVTSSYYQKKK